MLSIVPKAALRSSNKVTEVEWQDGFWVRNFNSYPLTWVRSYVPSTSVFYPQPKNNLVSIVGSTFNLNLIGWRVNGLDNAELMVCKLPNEICLQVLCSFQHSFKAVNKWHICLMIVETWCWFSHCQQWWWWTPSRLMYNLTTFWRVRPNQWFEIRSKACLIIYLWENFHSATYFHYVSSSRRKNNKSWNNIHVSIYWQGGITEVFSWGPWGTN